MEFAHKTANSCVRDVAEVVYAEKGNTFLNYVTSLCISVIKEP